MKKLSFLIVLGSILISRPAQSAAFDQIIAFGDSLSDNGNFYSLSGDTIPPSPPYYQGRFSNGPVWVEDMAASLNITLNDLAVGGAYTDNNNVAPGAPGLQTEVAFYTAHNPTADPNALYTFGAGGNDLLFENNVNPSQVATNVITAVSTLIGLGAKNILVGNLADLGTLPWSAEHGDAYAKYETLLTQAFNTSLSIDLSKLAQANPDVKLNLLDVYTMSNNTLNFYQNSGGALNPNNCITNAPSYNYSTISLVNGCSAASSNNYFFWDDVHPTAPVHAIIAQNAINQLGVPEPSNIVGSIAIVGLGIGLKKIVAKK